MTNGTFGVQFATNKADRALITKIAKRAMKELEALQEETWMERDEETGKHRRQRTKVVDIEMDVSATHANGNPLRLEDLLNADAFNFAHDIYGIRRHLDRDTGKLRNHFRPRFSVPASM